MKKLLSVLFVGALLLAGCSSSSDKKDEGSKSDDKVITIGATAAPHAEILDALKDEFKKEGYTLKVKVFDSYKLINGAVDNGELDADYFQHRPYLFEENESQGYDLVDLVGVHFEPLGIYSKDASKPNKDFSIDDVKEGSKFLVPNDPTNGARALLLLQDKGIIELDGDKGLQSTVADIKKFNKDVTVVEMDAESIAGALPDTDYGIINGNYAVTNKVEDKFIVGEDKDSEAAKEFENVIAIKKENKDSDKAKVIKKVLNSKTCKEFIEKTYKEAVIVTFE